MPLDFVDVLSSVDVTGMGCTGSEFNYICISFSKGDSPDPDFDLPLRNDEAVSCKRITCQGESAVSSLRSRHLTLPLFPQDKEITHNYRQVR